MKKFKLEVWPESFAVMGSVAEDEGAFFSTCRVQANDYENPDENMIREAFDFSVGLLQSAFEGVEITESSASVTYQEGLEKEPHEIVTAEQVHNHLEDAGYRGRTHGT